MLQSGLMLDRSEVEASRRPFRTGGLVMSSRATALSSMCALERMASHLAQQAQHE